ncbi:MAG: leucine-rich repeat protein [Tannerellaceae bacterium]|jgi:hypothetical protein|nr:leucine-rich repeat protein [Tannerellaceae bacterium]
MLFKCKICGGNLEVSPEMTVGTCAYCGTTMTLPRLSGERHTITYNLDNLDNLYNLDKACQADNDPEQLILTDQETLGERAFANCLQLNQLFFSGNISHISRGAFEGCTALHDLELNDCLHSIGEGAFKGCTSLQGIVFPKDLERIEDGAFEGCVALEDITVSGKVSVAQGAFEGCVNIRHILIEGERLESLLWLAPFFKDKTVRVTVSDNLKIIGEGAFRNCEFLAPIQIPAKAKEIGPNAFAGLTCMTKITVPNNVTVICEGAFENCCRLKEITFDARSQLLTIGDRAFAGCSQLKKIEIPDTVQAIGADAFAGCGNLKVIYMAKYGTTGKLYDKKKIALNHPAVTFSREEVLRLEKSAHTTITLSPKARKIKEQAFRFYSGIKSIEIPGKVEHIGTEAFEGCSGLERIVFPESVKYISERAFKDCTGLKNLVIPDTSIKICDEAFAGCTGLESVTLPGVNTVILCNRAFAECTALKEVLFTGSAPGYMYTPMSSVFRNTPFLEQYQLERERYLKKRCIYCGGTLNFWGNKCKACGKTVENNANGKESTKK